MREKKLQVFVSSTYTDLIEERQAAVEAILSSGNIPAGMELFAAGDESQMTVIKRWIDESDIYLLILGGRYGAIEKNSGKSYTQLEYEYALEQKKPLFAVVITDKGLDVKIEKLKKDALEQEVPQKLKEFRQVVLSNISRFWDDKKDIKIAIHETLADFGYRKELIGWIRADKAIDAGPLAEQIAALVKENNELRARLDHSPTIIFSGLTYYELKKLLEKEKSTLFEGTENLLEFFLNYGEELSRSVEIDDKDPLTIPLMKLAKFKLTNYKHTTYNTIRFALTNDGHNFYLKALALADL